jgi:branched-chain amino acid transport system permease protein
VLPYAFVVVIVGGLGSLPGAMVGSVSSGLLDNFGKALFPSSRTSRSSRRWR